MLKFYWFIRNNVKKNRFFYYSFNFVQLKSQFILKKINFLLVACTLFQSFCFTQTTCNLGFADIYPCNDYDLMSNVPISVLANTLGNPEGSDIWGWTDPLDGKEYAIIATTNSTAFVDISNPTGSIFLGRLDTQNGNTSYWRDVKVYNNYAFIVADNVGAHGMQVFDLTRLRNVVTPQTFIADTVFNDVGSCHNIVINESMGYAYLVGCNTFSGGPVFVDISNPLAPTGVGGYADKGYTHDAQVVTYNGPDTAYSGHEILIASNGAFSGTDKVVILDVTDKSNPVFIAEATYPNAGYAHQGWFTEDQRYFIMGDETDEQAFGMNSRTLVFDFLDLDNPILSSTYNGPSAAIDHNGYVKDDLFFLANYRAGMRVMDLSNVGAATNSLTEVGYFDTYPANNNTSFNGAWSIYPYFDSGNIIISDIERGLFVVRKSGTLNTGDYELESAFTITPNPTHSNPKVKSTNGYIINSLKVTNALGQCILTKNNIQVTEFVIPLNNLQKGMYFVTLNNAVTKKLLYN